MPPPLEFDDDIVWTAGEPDLIVRLPDVLVEGDAPDWWGEIESVPTGLTEDRYVKSVEIREVNDVPSTRTGTEHEGRHTVGGRFVVHHMIWSTRVLEGREAGVGAERASTDVGWPVHEVGREPDIFDEDAGRLLRAGSSVVSNSVHLHSNGRDTRAHLEIGFRFHPPDYEPRYRRASFGLGNGSDIDIRAGESGQELHAYRVLSIHVKRKPFFVVEICLAASLATARLRCPLLPGSIIRERSPPGWASGRPGRNTRAAAAPSKCGPAARGRWRGRGASASRPSGRPCAASPWRGAPRTSA